MNVSKVSFSRKPTQPVTDFTPSLASEGKTIFKKNRIPVNQPVKWGEEGHSIVAEIAQRRLATLHPDVLKKLELILGPGVSLGSKASWADDERGRDKATSRWHYVDIPLSENKYDPAKHCANIEGEGDCGIAALQRFGNELRAAPEDLSKLTGEQREKLARAVKFIAHIIGDLHQPLHTVDEKAGGNGVRVDVRFRGDAGSTGNFTTNLHSFFDTTVIQRTAWSWGSYVDRLEDGYLKTNAAKIPDLAKGTPTDWVEESHAQARKIWREPPEPKPEEATDKKPEAAAEVKPGEKAKSQNVVLDEPYFRLAQGVVDQQLSLAGVRLAEFLNDALGPQKPAMK